MRGKIVTLAIPNGIGDISWLISKIVNAEEKCFLLVGEGWPQRAHQYLELLPWLAGFKYNPHNYQDIMMFGSFHKDEFLTWESIVDSEYGCVFIEPNSFLEKGFRLEEWLPDLKTSFH